MNVELNFLPSHLFSPLLLLGFSQIVAIKEYETFFDPNVKRMSPNDPHSYSRPRVVKVKHMDIYLETNFDQKIMEGHVILSVHKVVQSATSIVLDVKNLNLLKVEDSDSGDELEYEIKTVSSKEDHSMGDRLEIRLPRNKKSLKIRIDYHTKNIGGGALNWISPSETNKLDEPIMYSVVGPIKQFSILVANLFIL